MAGLMEDAVLSEDAVEFKKESPSQVSQDLLERLLRARRGAVSSSSSSQQERSQGDGRSRAENRDGWREDVSDQDQKRGKVDEDDNPSGETDSCSYHPGVLLEYWCKDDSRLVCQECLIFGEHKGHTAITGEQRRSAAVMDRLGSLLPLLQTELKMTEKASGQIEMEGKDQFIMVKTEVVRWLDDAYVQEKKKVTSLLLDHIARLQKTISSIQSHQAGLFSPADQAMPDPDSVTKLVSDPVRLHMLPGTLRRQSSSLVLSRPTFRLKGGDAGNSSSDVDTSSMVTQSPPTSSPLQFGTSSSMRTSSTDTRQSQSHTELPKFKPLDLTTLDGATVTVMKNGSPGHFYCQLAGQMSVEHNKMEELLVDMTFESRILPPSLGQGVLVRWDSMWCRATVLEGLRSGWRCELVDLGQVVEVVTLEIADLPLSVLETPAMAAYCTLTSVKDMDWTEEARQDWEKLISGQQFMLLVEDLAVSSVHLIQGEVEMVGRLQFLGHFSDVDTVRTGQHFSPTGDLSTGAYLCSDYDQLSPDSLLLYFDNHLLQYQKQLLDQLDTLPHLVSPPGYIQPGHAVLAPWQGGLYRATVMDVTGTSLTVLYGDHGNTDTVSWWDCSAVPRDMLFPPLATQVRLAGLQPVREGGWTREGRYWLHDVLSNTSEKLEVTCVGMDKVFGGTVEVELFVTDKGSRQNIGQLLVEKGYACGSEGRKPDYHVSALHLSKRSSDGSSGEMMSNFLVGEETEFMSDQTSLMQHEWESDHMHGLDVVDDAEGSCMMDTGDNYKEDRSVDNRVYLTGNLTNCVTELGLATWAEQLWGEVDFVNRGYGQVVVDFRSRESADMCSRQGKAMFGMIMLEIIPCKLSLTNGVRVCDLASTSRRSDVMSIFTKFGDIAFIQGPFTKPPPATLKTAVVVFKDPEGMKKVLECGDIKQAGKKLLVQKNILGKKCHGVNNFEPTRNDASLEPKLSATVVDEAVEVEVLHVDSPHQVWVRLACDKDRWTQFHHDLQMAGNLVGLESGVKFETGQKVLCRVEGAWYRGSVLVVDKVCRVKLVDWGVVANVDIENVRKLEHSNIVKENLFTRSVRLGGIEPAGSGGWSASSVDFLTSLTKKKKVILVKKDDESEDLMVEEISATNPFDVETVDRISLAGILLERGLALKKDTRSKCARNWTGFVDEVAPIVVNEYTNPEEFNKKEIPLNRRLCSQVPQIPAEQVFTAMMMHIDCSAVVWVIPKTDLYILSEMVVEMASCLDPIQEVIAAMLVVVKLRGKNVRGRVLEVEGLTVRLVDIDSGEVFLSVTQDMCQVCSSLLYRPPLAIPVKLYGVRKTTSALCETGRAAVMDSMREKSSSPCLCVVSVMEKNLKQLPLPANVRYSMVEEYDGNLGLELVEVGLCEVITTYVQWEKELSDHGLEWMLDPMSVPLPLTVLPHPLPMAVGQWLQITVEGLEFPLECGEEHEPGVDNPDANRIGVHIRLLNSRATFDLYQQEISNSLRTVFPQVQKLSTTFNEDRILLAISASTAQLVLSPSVGQSVLAYYPLEEGGEWCRGTVETVQSKELVTVHYTDYGHRGQVEVRSLRSMNYQERMKPVQLREVVFRMPDSNNELTEVRKFLGREEVSLLEERLMMRVEKITPMGHPSELDEIMVSVWRAMVGESSLSFQLSRIC